MDSDFMPPKRPGEFRSEPESTGTQQTGASNAPAFQTPEEIAAADDMSEPSAQLNDPADPLSPNPEKVPEGSGKWASLKGKLALHWPPGKKEYIVAALVILIAAGGLVAWSHHHAKPPVHITKKVVKKPAKPTTVASILTGLQVAPSVNQKPVTGVMIENSLAARPQAGLSQAGVVFEAIAEGGITRFLALFLDNAPANVGPIRSARPYYIQWDLGFDAPYAHVGGSPEALADIKAWGVHDLDQFANAGSYHRISSREAPHNVYTSIAALNQLETAKGFLKSNFTSLERKAKEQPAKQVTAASIKINISGPYYNVHYNYNNATNSYKRNEGGAPHIDANGKVQINPKVVIVMAMPYGLEADDHHSKYSTIGDGPAFVFQDGTVTKGKWHKTSAADQFKFTDDTGKPILLNPGQTWLTAVGSPTSVSYTP